MMPTGSATAEVQHWKQRAESAERRVRDLLGVLRDVVKAAKRVDTVAERIGREQGA